MTKKIDINDVANNLFNDSSNGTSEDNSIPNADIASADDFTIDKIIDMISNEYVQPDIISVTSLGIPVENTRIVNNNGQDLVEIPLLCPRCKHINTCLIAKTLDSITDTTLAVVIDCKKFEPDEE